MRFCLTGIFIVCLFLFSLQAQSVPNSVYVVNTLGQNLSAVNLDTQSSTPDALPLGLYSNQVVVRGTKAYVVNSGTNEIQVIRLNPLETIRNIDLGAGSNPYNLAFVNDSIACVSELFTNRVALVNVRQGTVLNRIPVGTGPEGICYSGGYVFVTNSGFNGAGYDPGKVSVIDAATQTVIHTIQTGINPQAVTTDSLGHLLVVSTGDYGAVKGAVHVYDLASLQPLDTVQANIALTSVQATGSGKMLIGTYDGVLAYNQLTRLFEVGESAPLPGGPGIAVGPDGRFFITDFNSDSLRIFNAEYQKTGAYLVGDGPVSVALYSDAGTGISGKNTAAADFLLSQNYPNPFNPATTIDFSLDRSGQISLKIFNLLGEPVRTLVDRPLTAGNYQIRWDGRNGADLPAAAGIYFYRLQGDGFSETRKMQLIK